MQIQVENRQEKLKKRETGALIAADKVRGTDIYNRCGDNLGEVESIMIDKRSGQVAYAVVTFGGFLGIGTERRALPWNVLTYNVDLGGYVIDADNDMLRNMPAYPDTQVDTDTDGRRERDAGLPSSWQ